jgi:predicted ABC-type transport system involved in lysophospholipase L1 biosynthesis ATPase subunit
MSQSENLIRLSDVKRVFYTDEVETHALRSINLDIKKGEYISIACPSFLCGQYVTKKNRTLRIRDGREWERM